MSVTNVHGLMPHESCRHRVYKMTCSQFDALRVRADDRCEVCRATAVEFGSPLVIDHDHAHEGMAGVRGLLCGRCNAFLARVDSGARPPTVAEKRYLDAAWHKQQRRQLGPYEGREERLRFSGYIPARTLQRARGVVAALHGTNNQVSLNDLINAGLRRECASLEALTNNGHHYPPVEEVGRGAGGKRAPHAAASSEDSAAS